VLDYTRNEVVDIIISWRISW